MPVFVRIRYVRKYCFYIVIVRSFTTVVLLHDILLSSMSFNKTRAHLFLLPFAHIPDTHPKMCDPDLMRSFELSLSSAGASPALCVVWKCRVHVLHVPPGVKQTPGSPRCAPQRTGEEGGLANSSKYLLLFK